MGLAAWAAALGPQTASEVDRIGPAVEAGTPGPVEDTSLVEGSRMALEDNHEAGNLAGLQGQNAGSVGEDSIGESTVAVETWVDLAGEVAVAENAAAVDVAVDVAVDFAGPAGGFEREVAAAAVGSELAASTKECWAGERSAYYSQCSGKASSRPKPEADLVYIRRKATEISTWFCALGGTFCDLHPGYFIR